MSRFQNDEANVKTVIEGRWKFDGRRVVADEACEQIDALLRSLTPCGSTDGGWTKLYRDESGVFWELTYPQGELHGGGPPRLESLSRDEMRLKHPALGYRAGETKDVPLPEEEHQ